ncbi:MAG: hypothetical protein LBD93_03565 [Treponema sp.]|jgi:GT2 family glycosyltransferase|nr:hypothetical protein [Treponema sp.]
MTASLRQRLIRYLCAKDKNTGTSDELLTACFYDFEGSFMFLRMSIIKKHDLFFDEQFFMYCEDVDFIRRLHRFGKTLYLPDVFIIHDHAKASYTSKKYYGNI